MIMRSCEFCGSQIPENASYCGICGRVDRNAWQMARENGSFASPSDGIPGSAKRSTRKPYQFPPQPYQGQQQADVPAVAYSARTPAPSPVQQVPYVAAPAIVNPGSQRYPN